MKKIEWHKVTWYSKTLAVVLFIFVLPTITFYIGEQYMKVKQIAGMKSISSTNNIQQNIYPHLGNFIDPGFFIINYNLTDMDGDQENEIVFTEGTYTNFARYGQEPGTENPIGRISDSEKIILLKYNTNTSKWGKQIVYEIDDGQSLTDGNTLELIDLNNDFKREIFFNIAGDGSGMFHNYGFYTTTDGKMEKIEFPTEKDNPKYYMIINESNRLVNEYRKKHPNEGEIQDEGRAQLSLSVQDSTFNIFTEKSAQGYLIESYWIQPGKFINEGTNMNFYYTFDGKAFHYAKMDQKPYKNN